MNKKLKHKNVGEYECEIIYLKNSNLTGSHWLCYFKTPVIKLAYSNYGDPVFQELIHYFGKRVYTLDIQIQKCYYKTCGYYSLALIFLLSQGVNLKIIF